MKKILLILTFLLSLCATAQSKKLEFSLYIAAKTMHFARDPYTLSSLSSDEGGQGAFLSVRKYHSGSWYHEASVGALRNSYGDFTSIAEVGMGYKGKELDISLGIGIATGYQKYYYYNWSAEKYIPSCLYKNNLLPITTLNITYSKGVEIGKISLSPMFIISPAYVNAGIKIRKL